jgi:hypothetical protein
MKIAILISGEYRTFPICRKTMPFLDDERADVYVSTWDKSIVKNVQLNLDINNTITEDGVRKDLNRSATILIEPVECFVEKRYNSKMIHRWKTGFKMIVDSEIEYDYVLVTRPDLFFDIAHPSMFNLDSLIADDDWQFAWHLPNSKLQDCLFFLRLSSMKKLFNRLDIANWECDDEHDWHTWWTDFVDNKNIIRLGGHAPFSFCRPNVHLNMTFFEVYDSYIFWRDAQILHQIKLGNRDAVVRDWGIKEIEKIEAEKFKLEQSG